MQPKLLIKEIFEKMLSTAEINIKNLKEFKHGNYDESFTKEIKEYEISSKKEIKKIEDSLENIKGKNRIDEVENLQALKETQDLITKIHQDAKVISDKIFNKKKEDFLNGKFSNILLKAADKFIDMENVIRSAVKNANFPAYHIKDVEAIKELREIINYEREQGNLPLEAIYNLKTVLEDSHKKIIYSAASMPLKNKQSKSGQNLVRSLEEFARFTSFSTFHIEGSSNSDDKSRQTLEEVLSRKNYISDLPKGLFGSNPSQSLPSNEAPRPSNSAIGAGAVTLLALAATWYWMRQNAKTKEKPVEEKFNTKELKKISPLFGNENIKIESQNVYFNNFSNELYKDIKTFFPDSDKDIKATIKDKGLTLILSENLSAKKGKEVFGEFLKEFKDDLNKHAELSQQKRIEEELQIKRNQNEQKKINDLNNSKNIIRTSFEKIEEIKNTSGNESKKNKDIDEQTKKIRANLKILDGEELNPQYIKILLENSQKLSTSTNNPIDITAHQARETKYTTGANPTDPSTNPASLNAARAGGGGAVGRN